MATETRPRSALDRVLAVLDGAEHQHSDEQGLPAGTSMEDGLAAPDDPTLCARCQRHPLGADGELCGGCRAFLLGDSDPQAAPDWRDPSSYYAPRTARIVAMDSALPGPLCHLYQRPDGVIYHADDGRPLGVSYHHVTWDELPPVHTEAMERAAQQMAEALYHDAAQAFDRCVEALRSVLDAWGVQLTDVVEAAEDIVEDRRARDRERSRAAVRDLRRAQRRRGANRW